MFNNFEFNHHLLALAREARGIPEYALAPATNLSLESYRELTQGLLVPSNKVIKLLSETLHFQQSFFFDKWEPGPKIKTYSEHHKSLRDDYLTAAKIEAQQAIFKKNIAKLWPIIEKYFVFSNELCFMDLGYYDRKPEQVAEALREKWRIPHGAFGNIVHEMELAGIIIIEVDFGSPKYDGFSALEALDSPVPPVVFVNPNQTKNHYRFTLAHELGHLVMHQRPHINMENEADKFATAFLRAARHSSRADRLHASPETVSKIMNVLYENLNYSKKEIASLLGIFEDELNYFLPTFQWPQVWY